MINLLVKLLADYNFVLSNEMIESVFVVAHGSETNTIICFKQWFV
jgi:hypothetical protein